MPSETLMLSADTLPEAGAGCKIQPVVMIFDSKPRHFRQKHAKKPVKPSAAASGKTFAFVNISRPGKADEESRRMVKTHVMQDVLRRRSRDCFKLVKTPQSLYLSQHFSRSVESAPQAPLSYPFTFPIQIKPYMLKLVHEYGNRAKSMFERADAGAMLPTESKVMDSAWMPLIMTDAALFHALLCTSALLGVQNMTIQRKHMLICIRLINERLSGDRATSDATIIAVLFMAKAEYFQRNHSAWSMHMEGVKKIVELRGGIGMLSRLTQEKLCSTDLLGCMEIGAVPHFPIINLTKPLSLSYLRDLPPAVISLAETYTLDLELLALLSEITTHTTSLPAVHGIPSLQYRLLSLSSTRQHQHPLPSFIIMTKPFCSQVQQAQSEIVQELLLNGALLYLSLPHTRALPPIRPVDYSYLLSRLTSFASPLFNHHTLLKYPEFLLWLSFLGEVFSSSSIPLSTRAGGRSPFRLQLRAVSIMLETTSWDEMKMVLGTMWAIEQRHETTCRRLWEEIMNDLEICYEL